MQAEQCSSVILSRQAYGDNDQVISAFTLEHGRLSAFARSAAKSRKRFVGSLDPASQHLLMLKLKQDGLSFLERSEQVMPAPGFGNRLGSLALAFYSCELVEQLTPEGQPLPRLFRLLSVFLKHLAKADVQQGTRRFFEINLLNILGYCPPLTGSLLAPLRACLATARFDSVVFLPAQLDAAGQLLDQELERHCPRSRRSLEFLAGVL
ncbi:MAG: DNA repair protein RecO [Trichlorobacter sp.]|nr:DNA repair protein RecO [Trichlorobacter sp.]